MPQESYIPPVMKAPVVKTPTELLVYCEEPNRIVVDNTLTAVERLRQALNTLVVNHGIYAKCYERQKRLVDSVIRREQ